MRPHGCVGGHLRSAAYISSSIRLLVLPSPSQNLQPYHQLSSAAASSASRSTSRPASAAARLSCRQYPSTLGGAFSACRGQRGRASAAGSALANGDAAANDTWLVVGLGNPGAQYEGTRHNVSEDEPYCRTNLCVFQLPRYRGWYNEIHAAMQHATLSRCALTTSQIGFEIVDRLAADAGILLDKKQHNALVGRGRLHGLPVLLAKPTTFMNSSGKAVRKLVDYYKVPRTLLFVSSRSSRASCNMSALLC